MVVAHQIVAGRLPRGVEAAERHAEVAGAQRLVRGDGQPLAVERPVQRTGVDAGVRRHPATGRQVGAHAEDGVLGVYQYHIWGGLEVNGGSLVTGIELKLDMFPPVCIFFFVSQGRQDTEKFENLQGTRDPVNYNCALVFIASNNPKKKFLFNCQAREKVTIIHEGPRIRQ